MKYDQDKVDDMVLALLYLTTSSDAFATRAWKGLDLETLQRLHQKGYISDPMDKKPTLVLTEAGAQRSKELFFRYFGLEE